MPGLPANATSTELPSQLGRFQILRQLGSGAQSVVYLAFDPQLQREVAIKALRGAASSSEALLNEARAVGRLSHPAIVPVFEVGEALPGQTHATSGGRSGAYLVFEYVPGPTLADLLREQGALEARLAVRLLLPVLEALEYAHSCDVIHRDLKPSNILMDRRGSARVMDFGIAVRSAAEAALQALKPAPDPEAMGSTTLMGTPAYMAPEYAQDGTSTPQMDVFSAGLILYEMLLGERAAPDNMGYQAVLFLMHQDVRLPEETPHPVDAKLRAIVQRAAARERAERYADMASLVDDLRDWQSGLPAPAAAPARTVARPAPAGVALGPATVGPMSMAAPTALAAPVATGVPATPATPVAEITTPLRAAMLQERHAQDKLRLLLRRVQSLRDYPLLPASVGQVLPLASSDRQKLVVLSQVVMGDTGLSLKLLRLVNSSLYSALGQGAVSTVSTAIQLLGYAAVRSASTSVGAMGMLKDASLRARLLDDSLLAMWCGTVASSLSGLGQRDAEEAFVCGSLQWLAPMLITHGFAAEAAQIDRLAPLGGVAPFGQSAQQVVLSGHRERAARHVLGVGQEMLGKGAARHWGLPEILVQSLTWLAQGDDGEPLGAIAITQNRAEYLRALANCARELAHAWLQTQPERATAALLQVVSRYSLALGLNIEGAQQAMAVAAAAVKRQLLAQSTQLRADFAQSLLAQRCGLVGRPAQPRLGQASHLAQDFSVAPAVPGQGAAGVARSLQLLTLGMRRVADQHPTGTGELNPLLRGLLETLQEATGLERVMMVLREARGQRMTGRMAVGPMVLPDASAFQLALDDQSDPFAAAVREARDLWVPDATREGMRPAWHLQNFQTGAYLILPLRHKGQPMGLIYADHTRPGTVVLTDRVRAELGRLRDLAIQLFVQARA